ncbi:MAG: lysylphosphatidylglycerol synthase transmembrane domain-containing protein, partial [Thermodesulfobacteriota bacterium]|nr:lysylphosphatidylglycerol synthase transmembrane domain-containing protein [Thermodesulfobacteriota bacterium]
MNRRLTVFFSIAVGLLFVGIWLYIIDFSEMLTAFKSVRVSFFFPLGIFFILMYFLRSLRWKIIVSPIQKITIFESFNLCMTNYFVNFLIPVHAGELAKSLLLRKMKGTPVAKSLPTVYIDKVAELLPLFLLLMATPLLEGELIHLIYLASGILLLILLLLVFVLSFSLNRMDVAIEWIERICFFL